MGGGTRRLAGRDVFYSDFKNCLYGRRDGTFFIPALKTVYMGGGTRRLAGRDVFYSDFKNCLYGRRDGTFFIPALKTVYMGGGTRRLAGRDVFYSDFKNCLYERRDGEFTWECFLSGTISPGTICKVSIISSPQSWTECLYDKNCPTFPGRDEKHPSKIISI